MTTDTAQPLSAWARASSTRVSPVSSGTSPVRDEHGAAQLGGQGEQAALDGAAGALDLVLVGEDEVGVDRGAHGDHPVAVVAHDHADVLGPGGARGADRVADEGDPADGVQDLGSRGLHPGALTGSEDDDGGRAGGAHARGLQTCCGVPRDARHATRRGRAVRRPGARPPAGGHGIRHDVRGTTSTRPPRPVGRERSTDDGDGERGERGVPRRAGLHVPHGRGRRGRTRRHGDHRHRRRRPAPRPGRSTSPTR